MDPFFLLVIVGAIVLAFKIGPLAARAQNEEKNEGKNGNAPHDEKRLFVRNVIERVIDQKTRGRGDVSPGKIIEEFFEYGYRKKYAYDLAAEIKHDDLMMLMSINAGLTATGYQPPDWIVAFAHEQEVELDRTLDVETQTA